MFQKKSKNRQCYSTKYHKNEQTDNKAHRLIDILSNFYTITCALSKITICHCVILQPSGIVSLAFTLDHGLSDVVSNHMH